MAKFALKTILFGTVAALVGLVTSLIAPAPAAPGLPGRLLSSLLGPLGPPDVVVTAPDAGATTASSGTISFVAHGVATLRCSLDETPIRCGESGSVPFTNLADGNHTFDVRGSDSLGRTKSANREWNVDAVGPTMVIQSPAEAAKTGPSGTITFSSAPAGDAVSVACALDGGTFASCDNGTVAFSGFVDGSRHQLAVIGTDAFGNAGPTATRTWFVDAQGPTIIISSPVEGASTAPSGLVRFSSGDAATVVCALDAAAFVPCVGSYGYSNLDPGVHKIRIVGTDGLGNAGSATRSWIVDAP